MESFLFFTSREIYLLRSELFLTLMWLLSFMVLLFPKKVAYLATRIVIMAVLVANLGILLTYFPLEEQFFWKGLFYQNFLSIALKVLLNFFALIALWVQLSYQKTLPEWFVILLGGVLSAEFLLSSASVLGIYVSLEMMSICGYLLVAFFSKDEKMCSYPAALNYLIFGAVSSACMLYGFSWLYGISYSLHIPDIYSYAYSGDEQVIFYVGNVLIAVGFLFKFAIIPLHFWISEVYTKASSAVALFLATVPKIATSGIVFLMLSSLQHQDLSIQQIIFDALAIVAAISVLGGAFLATQQSHIKRLFAYSGVSQMGFMLVLLLFPSDLSEKALLVFWLFYGFANIIVWKFCAELAIRGSNLELRSFKFPTYQNALLTTASLSLAGLPPFGGFLVKLIVFLTAFQHYQRTESLSFLLLLIAISIATVIGFYYYFKVPYYLFLKNRKSIGTRLFKISKSSAILLTLLVLLNVGLVLFAIPLLNHLLN